MKTRMKIQYPNGRKFEGTQNFYPIIEKLRLKELNLQNKSVLDIACDEGFWAFWSEMQGAKPVYAIDVERGENYDWGGSIDTEWIEKLNTGRIGRTAFDFHHNNLESSVQYYNKSIYDINDLEQKFDIIFNFGLLYHLRHPLFALDQCSLHNKDLMVLETHVNNSLGYYHPVCHFYRTVELGGCPSNWSGPSTGCMFNWLKDVGYQHIFLLNKGKDRQIFISCKKDETAVWLHNNRNVTYLDKNFEDQSYYQFIKPQ